MRRARDLLRGRDWDVRSHVRDQETIAQLDDWGLYSVCCHHSRLVKARLVAGQVPLARESRNLVLSQEQIL
jgi:hypothetical protein